MDKKISEMKLEELQDYALQLEQDKTILNSSLEQSKKDYAELDTLNKTLQRRNHELFLKVEQQHTTTTENNEDSKQDAVKTYEELATELKGVIK